MATNLVIQTRIFDLLDWLLPKGEKFPKAQRFTVTQRLLNCALDLQDAVIRAECTRGEARQQALADADVHLARLRVYLRLIHRWAWLSHGQYQHVSSLLVEIGKLLGGWIKAGSRNSV